MTIKETCRLLGVGRTSVYALLRAKKLKLKKIGKRTLITFESIRQLAEEGDEEAA